MKNPGAAYHKQKSKDWSIMQRGAKAPELISLYGALAEDAMYDARRSKYLGIPNPKRPKWMQDVVRERS